MTIVFKRLSDSQVRLSLFAIFTLSGFAGLIYESIWTHYLKLFLGHAAYAQTLVLAVYMGGMALGAWLASKYSKRYSGMLLGYAIVEVIIGLCALFFHDAFVAILKESYSVVIPALGRYDWITFYKWGLSCLLILPQSTLLGATFPLMSTGIVRRFPAASGRTLALLYFTNSFGAAVGILVAGFVLRDAFGLPGTMIFAGTINILVGIVTWVLARGTASKADTTPVNIKSSQGKPVSGLLYFFLLCACVTGLASFIYEIAWIRMLSQVLGSSTHAFEMMLSAFIFGLAFGGLFVKSFIDASKRLVEVLGWVQVLMGIFACLTLMVYSHSFSLMGMLVKSLPHTDMGYSLFNLSSHMIALMVMLPATFCAGMTLPLLTNILLRRGYGEQSIGQVYAINTLGAIIGVLISVHWIMPWFGLKTLIVAGGTLDIILGLVLLYHAKSTSTRSHLRAWLLSVGVLLITIFLVHLDHYQMAAGVYRYGEQRIHPSQQMIFRQDGKTATINVTFDPRTNFTIIRTNGKPDASMHPFSQSPAGDEYTQILTAAIPWMFKPQAKQVAVIGMGSGITSHLLLHMPSIQALDTIDIESAMVEGAKAFYPRNKNVYDDPRSHIVIEDAKSYFSSQRKKYDLIISEPSNPWVSGVASLFSDEFYQLVKTHLSQDGILVQWLQSYEMNTSLLVSIMKAIQANFKDYVIYETDDQDILVVATDSEHLPSLSDEIFQNFPMKKELSRIWVDNINDIKVRWLGNREIFKNYVDFYNVPMNSDFNSHVDLHAVKARFLDKSANAFQLINLWLPVARMLGNDGPQVDILDVTPTDGYYRSEVAVQAAEIYNYAMDLTTDGTNFAGSAALEASLAGLIPEHCVESDTLLKWQRRVSEIGAKVSRVMSYEQLTNFWDIVGAHACVERLSPQQRQWYDLFYAIAERDNATVMKISEQLLAQDLTDDASDTPIVYLLGLSMLGHMSADDPQGAVVIYRNYKHVVSRILSNADKSTQEYLEPIIWYLAASAHGMMEKQM